jgi:hypothetical protein
VTVKESHAQRVWAGIVGRNQRGTAVAARLDAISERLRPEAGHQLDIVGVQGPLRDKANATAMAETR